MPLHDLLLDDPPPDAIRDHVGLDYDGPVAVVTLARPEKYNALSLASWRRLYSVFRSLSENQQGSSRIWRTRVFGTTSRIMSSYWWRGSMRKGDTSTRLT